MSLKAVAKRAPVYITAKFFAAEDVDQPLFTADRDYEVVEVIEVHSATDASGTVALAKTASGTAIASATAITTTFDLGSTADTPVHKTKGNGGVSSTASTRLIGRGDTLHADFAGTLNDTFIGALTIVLQPVGGGGE
jgi:hypothetical protein